MIIRELETSDIPALAELYRVYFDECSNPEKMAVKLTELKKREEYIVLAAEEDGKLAGSVTGTLVEDLYGECIPFLVVENMVVDGTVRRKGVGKALFAELERRAKQKGCRQVLLITETYREEARRFYESIGFPADGITGYKKKL